MIGVILYNPGRERKEINETKGQFLIMEEKAKFSKKSSIYEEWCQPGNEYTSVRRHPGDRNGFRSKREILKS